MSKPVDAFVNGMCAAAGTYVANEYVIPASVYAAEKTAKKTKEVAEQEGNAIFSSASSAAVGVVVAGPPGAVVGGALGWLSGKEQDERASKVLQETGEDERCILQ